MVSGAFGFLERERRFTFEQRLTAPECEWRWTDREADVAIVVTSEYAGVCWKARQRFSRALLGGAADG